MVIVTVSRLSTDRVVSPSPRRRRTQYTAIDGCKCRTRLPKFYRDMWVQRNYRCVVSIVCTRWDFGHVTNRGLPVRCIDAPLVASTDMSDIFIRREFGGISWRLLPWMVAYWALRSKGRAKIGKIRDAQESHRKLKAVKLSKATYDIM